MSITWVAILESSSARIHLLDAANRSLVFLKEVSARPGADAAVVSQNMMTDLARYLDVNSEKDQFAHLVLVSEPKRAGGLAGALGKRTCMKYIGSVMAPNGSKDLKVIFESIEKLYANDLGIAAAK